MTLLEQFIDRFRAGDAKGLADLFTDDGVLHDNSWNNVGQDTLHLVGKMAVEMMFHSKFGFNRGPFPIHAVHYTEPNIAWYYIQISGQVVPVIAYLNSQTEDGKIDRINILHL